MRPAAQAHAIRETEPWGQHSPLSDMPTIVSNPPPPLATRIMPIPTRCTLGPRLVATIVLATPLLATPPQAPQGGLAARYEQQLTEVRAELERAMPKVRAKQRQAFLEARDAEKAAVAALAAAQQELGKVGTAKALVGHAKGKWIGGADRGIQQANQMMAKAKTPAEKQAAAVELVKWQQNRKEEGKRKSQREYKTVCDPVHSTQRDR